MATPYDQKLADPEFQKDFELLSPADQAQLLKDMGVPQETPLTKIMGVPAMKLRHKQGLQPEPNEPTTTSLETPLDKLMKGAATAGTVGAAAAMVPASAIPGITTLGRAGAAGVAGGGLDALFGGAHPVKAGLETAAGSLALENPYVAKLLKFVTSPAKKLILESLFKGEQAAAPEEAATGSSLLKKQLMKYSGSTDPGYSPPPARPGTVNVNPDSIYNEPWSANKVNYNKATGTQLSGPSFSTGKPTKKAEEVLTDWMANVKKKQKATGTPFGGSTDPGYSPPSRSVSRSRSIQQAIEDAGVKKEDIAKMTPGEKKALANKIGVKLNELLNAK